MSLHRSGSKYPARMSVSQHVDTVRGQLVETLICGHVVETPFHSRHKPYTAGTIRRRCHECWKAENKYAPAPKRTLVELVEAATSCSVSFQCFPISQQLSGVYCLIRRDRVMYVGQSRNLLARLGTHVKRWKKRFDAIQFAHVPVDQLDRVESTLIWMLRPPLNKTIPGRGPIQNLHTETEKSDFSREVGVVS
jgi:hypothetical protein